MMEKRKNIFLVVIVIAGFILRFSGLINIRPGGDFAYHWEVAGSIAKRENFPLLGPSASISPDFHLGPFYYYLLAIPYLLGGGNYQAAIIFFSLISTFSIYLLYRLSREWFGQEESLKVTALYAFSSYMITTGNFPWNAYLVLFFIIFILYLLAEMKKGKTGYLVPISLLYALALQSHATSLFLAPLLLLNIPYRKIKPGNLIVSLFVFVLFLSPWFAVEFANGFEQTKNLFSAVFARDSETCVFSEWIINHGHGERCFHYYRNTLFIFRLFSMSLFTNTSFWTTIFSAVLVLYTLLVTKSPARKFFWVWLTSVFVLYLFYASNIYMHYMLILVPLPFFVVILFLQKIKTLKNGKFYSNLIFILLIANNLAHFLLSLGVVRI